MKRVAVVILATCYLTSPVYTQPLQNVELKAVIELAEGYFTKGRELAKKGQHKEARAAFDNAVDVFLNASDSARQDPQFEKHYMEMVGRVYQEERAYEALTELPPSVRLKGKKPQPSPRDKIPDPLFNVIGPMPRQFADGRVPAVIRYLNDNLHDPYSMKLIKWSKIRVAYRNERPYWYVSLRMRAKNAFGAYILRESGFYIRRNKVVLTDDL